MNAIQHEHVENYFGLTKEGDIEVFVQGEMAEVPNIPKISDISIHNHPTITNIYCQSDLKPLDTPRAKMFFEKYQNSHRDFYDLPSEQDLLTSLKDNNIGYVIDQVGHKYVYYPLEKLMNRKKAISLWEQTGQHPVDLNFITYEDFVKSCENAEKYGIFMKLLN